MTNSIFKSVAFPDIAYFVNGLFYTADKVPIPQGDIGNLLFKHSEKIVFKIDSSIQGLGIFFFEKSTFDIENIRFLGNGVFQTYIKQHKLFDNFVPNSVATLRITTVVDNDGVISVRACYLRMGRVEDTHIQSKSHIRVPISLSNGEFAREGFLPNWLTIEEHPDTKLKFSGHKVPPLF